MGRFYRPHDPLRREADLPHLLVSHKCPLTHPQNHLAYHHLSHQQAIALGAMTALQTALSVKAVEKEASTSPPSTPDSIMAGKKKNWLPGKLSKTPEVVVEDKPRAWIAGLPEHLPYDLGPLFQGEKVSRTYNTATACCLIKLT